MGVLETRCEPAARRRQAPESRQSGGGERSPEEVGPGLGQREWVNEEAGKQGRAIKSL